MSARLVRQIAEKGKGRHAMPVVLFMKSGRTYEGDLGKIDAPNGTVEIKIKDGVTHRLWTALVDTDSIEAVQPRWEGAA